MPHYSHMCHSSAWSWHRTQGSKPEVLILPPVTSKGGDNLPKSLLRLVSVPEAARAG